ncbi:TetR/AcrR family transcriptional regulator [Nocardia sp. alder85J]|uniref:TetR/AcrR family transcriptional regulator n=1 Tax=Nocardia sp. alder85J TaxID=2862949 RepID=UPI001CD4ADDD|nr:TetR-like C-terminal domain-containing protein [Nocardia sp. alder85J]MCX4095888.1 TetR-like C-terminal domain-containing protein [Nocardia sp. alder85J]
MDTGTGRRPRNARGEGERLRADLVEAAAGLLADSGDARLLTLAAVARAVGVATPSIYRHFPDRGQLVAAVVADLFGRLDAALVEAMRASADPAGRLRACCVAYCHFGLENPGHYRVLFNAELALDPARPGERPGERAFERLVVAIEAGMAAGVVAPGDPEFTALTLWAALHGIVSLRISRPHRRWPAPEALVDAVLPGPAGPS